MAPLQRNTLAAGPRAQAPRPKAAAPTGRAVPAGPWGTPEVGEECRPELPLSPGSSQAAWSDLLWQDVSSSRAQTALQDRQASS